jgi:signal transduction histidine kinase
MAENQIRHLGNAPLIGTVVELNSQIKRLITLMDYLLDVSKIQKDKLILEKTSFDLSKLTKLTIKPIIISSRHHTISQVNSIEENVYADKNRISQVITNLVLNAVKYSPEGGKILISMSKKDTVHEFCVQDFGIGISESEQSKIFTRFFRADITRHLKIGGVGLGLYIAQKIVKSHGGKIWMKSTKGVGSTFAFNLPIKV